MEDFSLENYYEEFKQEINDESVALGKSQQEVFFDKYNSIGSENGNFPDLTYNPYKYDHPKLPIQIDGYSFDEEQKELYLVIVDFEYDNLLDINLAELDRIFNKLERFYKHCKSLEFFNDIEESSLGYKLARDINLKYGFFKRVKFIIITDRLVKTRKENKENKVIDDKTFTYSVLDFKSYNNIERSNIEGNEIEIDILELKEKPIKNILANSEQKFYKSYLAVMPGTLLAKIYAKYGSRVLESNVRSFLQARTKVNRGIRLTIENNPSDFFAFNNGLTVTASELKFNNNKDITFIKDIQIVNGGQTTASILHANDSNYPQGHQKQGKIDINKIFVPMKLNLINDIEDKSKEYDNFVKNVSRFSNSQNAVKSSDLESYSPYHIHLENLSRRIIIPSEGLGTTRKWFYERNRGQYKTSYRNNREKTIFQKEYPFIFSKRDLGFICFSFNYKPWLAAEGQEKSFSKFSNLVSKEFEKSPEDFGDVYYQSLIAKKIIFNSIDKLIAKSDFYNPGDGGNKRPKVIYTIAMLVKTLNNYDRAIDYQKIWNEQKISSEFSTIAKVVAEKINYYIDNPPSGISNPSEFAKKEECWKNIEKNLKGAFAFSKHDFSAFSISLEKYNLIKKENKKEEKKNKELDLVLKVSEYMPYIKKIAQLTLKRKNLHHPKIINAIAKLSKSNPNPSHLTKQESKNFLAHIKKLEELGLNYKN